MKTLSLALALCACSSEPAPSTSRAEQMATTCTRFVATGDATLSTTPMDKNFGRLPILRVGGKDESLAQFDLRGIPASAAITSAALAVYVAGQDDGAPAPVEIHRAR